MVEAQKQDVKLRKAYFCPLTYFFVTRYSDPGPLYIYLALNIGFCFLAIIVSNGGLTASLSAISGYLSAWLAFTVVYELGYLMNDSLSAERERAKGIKRAGARKPVLTLTYGNWIWLLIVRILILSCVFPFMENQFSIRQCLWVGGAIASMSITFALHNILFPPWRVLTFGGLYASKYLLCIPFLGNSLGVGMFGILAAPLILIQTLAYGGSRVSGNREYRSRNGIILSDMTVCAIFLYLVYAVVLRAASHPDNAMAVWRFILYLVAVDIVYRAISLTRALRSVAGYDGIKYHAHTSYSHDGRMNLGDLRDGMEGHGWRRFYLAEHAEDFDPESYETYREECKRLSSENVRLVPGIEYNVCFQHVLALGLTRFIPVRDDCPEDIIKLYPLAERIVWAHPSVSLRRLYDLKYVWQTLRVGMLCEAVEWNNRKSASTGRNALRSKCVCVALYLIRPGRGLISAEDVHSYEDIKLSA
jgi:hypothetical protein